MVYLVQNDREDEIMRDVILKPVEEDVRLHALFEEPLIVRVRVSRFDVRKRTVKLLPAE